MPRCRHYSRAAAVHFNAVPLPPKLRFHQATSFAAKLASATALLPLLPPLPRCHRCATVAYKIEKKYVILFTNLFFTTMVMAACSNNGRSTRQQ
jgi:hypothetical protein